MSLTIEIDTETVELLNHIIPNIDKKGIELFFKIVVQKFAQETKKRTQKELLSQKI